MSKYTVELDIEQIDRIVADDLIRCRQTFVDDLAAGNNIFVWGDSAADDIEIQKHIDAFDVVLSWYCTPEQLEDVYGDDVLSIQD
jgi:hypothetical protein